MEKYNTTGNEMDSLITSYLSGNASEEDASRLNEWVSQSEENRRYFRAFCDIWQLSAGLQHFATEDNTASLQQLNAKIDFKEELEETYSGKSVWLPIFKYAAGILLFLAVGYFAGRINFGTDTKDSSLGKMAVIYAPMGSKAISILPDGTQVWLNAGSKIEYNTHDYNVEQRAVALTGEAYFKVKTNPEKPFVVNAKGINVKALGTEFNVKAYPEENQVVTTLVKGIVKIEGKDQDQNDFVVDMKPNQIVRLKAPVISARQPDNAIALSTQASTALEKQMQEKETRSPEAPVVVDEKNLNKYTSWKDNQWVLEGEDLGNLVVMLERKFNVQIHVESPELRRYKFTGTFRNETLEQVLSVLKIATPVKYSIGKGTVTLSIDPVLKARYQKFITD